MKKTQLIFEINLSKKKSYFISIIKKPFIFVGSYFKII